MSSVKRNFIYNSLYQFLAILIPLITTPYISRVLGADGVGLYSYSYSIAYYFVMIAMLGLNNYGNRTIAMARHDKKKLSQAFWSIYTLQLLTSILSIGLYLLYLFLFSNNLMSWILLIYVISAAFDVNWFFFGLEEFRLTVTRNCIIKILTTIGIFIFIKTKSDVYWYGSIMVLGILISQLMIWPFIKTKVDFYRPSFSDIAIHFKPNLILFIPVIAVSLYKIMDKIMLGAMTNVTQVGLYESSEKVIQIPMALINSLGTVMLPKMSNLVAQGNIKESRKFMSNSILFASFLSTSICFGIMGISKEFVPIFFGEGFDMCIYLLQVLLPSCIFIGFANVIRTQYLIPNQKDKIYISSVLVGAVTNAIINYLLIPRYQAVGAAVGTLVAEASVCILQCLAVKNDLDLKNYISQSIPFLLSGIIMYIILINLYFPSISINGNLIIKILIGAFIYLSCLGILFVSSKIIRKIRNQNF